MSDREVAEIGRRVSARMQELGIESDAELCRLAGFDRFYLNSLRRGREPRSLYLAKIARALNCTVSYLLGETSESGRPLDESRLIEVVTRLKDMADRGELRLAPDEFAELAMHAYNHPEDLPAVRESLSSIVIGWLSRRLKGE